MKVEGINMAIASATAGRPGQPITRSHARDEEGHRQLRFDHGGRLVGRLRVSGRNTVTHAIGGLRADAARRGLPVTAEVRDLETGAAGLGSVCFGRDCGGALPPPSARAGAGRYCQVEANGRF